MTRCEMTHILLKLYKLLFHDWLACVFTLYRLNLMGKWTKPWSVINNWLMTERKFHLLPVLCGHGSNALQGTLLPLQGVLIQQIIDFADVVLLCVCIIFCISGNLVMYYLFVSRRNIYLNCIIHKVKQKL